MITLLEINESNYKACLNLSVSEDQSSFVSSNSTSLAKAYIYRDRIFPFAIYAGDLMVGFIMSRYNNSNDSYFIWQFMIDKNHQNKGYGKAALHQKISWIKEQKNCSKIVTTVIDGNDYVKRLYQKMGFKQMGDSEEGETDYMMQL